MPARRETRASAARPAPANPSPDGSSGAGASGSSASPPAKGTHPSRPMRIYADGIFDLFHFGHARALEQAKTLFPHTYLMVGCCNDELTHRYKGKTVLTEEERYESLRHCRWVDEVVRDAPWVVTPAFLDAHAIDYVAHDALPYADASGATDDVYGVVKRLGRFMETKRTEGVSTSDIILRILRDYNDYVLRNLSRGYTRHDLGVSLVKEQQLRVRKSIQRLSEGVRRRRAAAGGRVGPPRLFPRDVEAGLKDFATGVEALMDKVITGELGDSMARQTDRMLSGFMQSFEDGYLRFEHAVRARLRGMAAGVGASPPAKGPGRASRGLGPRGGVSKARGKRKAAARA